MTHELKCWPEYFSAIRDGQKTFEARKNDRNYQTGDILILEEFAPYDPATFTGEKITKRVSYILHGPAFGVQEGYCIMALSEPDMHDTPEYQRFVEESEKHCACCMVCGRDRPCAGTLAGGMCDQACDCSDIEHHWDAPRDFGDD